MCEAGKSWRVLFRSTPLLHRGEVVRNARFVSETRDLDRCELACLLDARGRLKKTPPIARRDVLGVGAFPSEPWRVRGNEMAVGLIRRVSQTVLIDVD